MNTSASAAVSPSIRASLSMSTAIWTLRSCVRCTATARLCMIVVYNHEPARSRCSRSSKAPCSPAPRGMSSRRSVSRPSPCTRKSSMTSFARSTAHERNCRNPASLAATIPSSPQSIPNWTSSSMKTFAVDAPIDASSRFGFRARKPWPASFLAASLAMTFASPAVAFAEV